ncbi:MAG: gliding motility lipoprotein GldH [Algoriphagus sp.]|nr:gliding motility lipoprotein GldH [Algoriphagus sp.]
MNRIILFLLIPLLLSTASCSQNRLFEQFHPFDEASWSEQDSALFDLRELPSIDGKSLIAVKYTDTYGFSNCYIRVITRDSSRSVLQNKLLNVPIFDSKSGQPLGEGFGNTFTKYDTLPFDLSKGTKEVILVQYMRQAKLEGIEAVGFKVLKP